MQCNGRTQSGNRCKRKTQGHFCPAHAMQGEGIWDDTKAFAKKSFTKLISPITNRINAVRQGPRTTATARFQKFLDDNAGHKVVKVELGRKPIVPLVHKALDALSLGRFSKTAKMKDYSTVYHNFVLITLDDGRVVKLEKNEVVVQKPATKSDYSNEVWDIPLNGKTDLTLKGMIDTASSGNEKNFWKYRAGSDNCQRFSRDIIEKNGLLPEEVPHMEVQDAKALTDSLPAATHFIPNLVTDTAAVLDRAVHGDGMKKKKKKIRTEIFGDN